MRTKTGESRYGQGIDGVVEEGQALRRLTDISRRDGGGARRERVDVAVIGAGQAGLSVGYHLARRGLKFVILNGDARVGDTWRKRWDSLRLFTPSFLDSLDGMPFPAPRNHFPTKDEMADYLESYAARFKLPVRNGARVDKLTRHGDGYLLRTDGGVELEAAQVVVAMATFQKPRIPELGRQLRSDIVQLHGVDYKNPAQLRAGDVLIVGAGNSGAEIAMDLAPHHKIWMSGRKVGEVPFNIRGLPARLFLGWLVMRVLFHRILTVRTRLGRKLRPQVLSKGGPLIRQKEKDLVAAGIERVSRIASVRDGLPVLEDGRTLDVANVVWCSGFHPGFSWIDLPIFDERGEPEHEAGVVPKAPGLYFVGLHFLYSFSSTMIHGVGRDAARIAATVATRQRQLSAEVPDAAQLAAV